MGGGEVRERTVERYLPALGGTDGQAQIDQVDTALATWAMEATGSAAVSLDVPNLSVPEPGLCLYLLEIRPRPQAAGATHTVQVSLRYLATAWASTTLDSHRLLSSLLLAALANPELEVDLTPPPPEAWAALGCAPRPSLILQVPLRQPKAITPAPRVKSPLVVQLAATTPLYGQVVGPAGVPVPGARVSLPELGVSQETDMKGRFEFQMVPAGGQGLDVVVAARGSQVTVQASQATSADRPLVVQLVSLEDADA